MDSADTRQDEIARAVAQVLAAADEDIAARRPVCRASGRCCRFEAFGHRLYVSAAELLHFSHTLERGAVAAKGENQPPKNAPVSLPQFFAQADVAGCPYQIDGLCTARDARPLGCRIYFCDENTRGWQEEVYEKYHGQLKAIHERFGIPYRYLEWRAALRELLPRAGAG